MAVYSTDATVVASTPTPVYSSDVHPGTQMAVATDTAAPSFVMGVIATVAFTAAVGVSTPAPALVASTGYTTPTKVFISYQMELEPFAGTLSATAYLTNAEPTVPATELYVGSEYVTLTRFEASITIPIVLPEYGISSPTNYYEAQTTVTVGEPQLISEHNAYPLPILTGESDVSAPEFEGGFYIDNALIVVADTRGLGHLYTYAPTVEPYALRVYPDGTPGLNVSTPSIDSVAPTTVKVLPVTSGLTTSAVGVFSLATYVGVGPHVIDFEFQHIVVYSPAQVQVLDLPTVQLGLSSALAVDKPTQYLEPAPVPGLQVSEVQVEMTEQQLVVLEGTTYNINVPEIRMATLPTIFDVTQAADTTPVGTTCSAVSMGSATDTITGVVKTQAAITSSASGSTAAAVQGVGKLGIQEVAMVESEFKASTTRQDTIRSGVSARDHTSAFVAYQQLVQDTLTAAAGASPTARVTPSTVETAKHYSSYYPGARGLIQVGDVGEAAAKAAVVSATQLAEMITYSEQLDTSSFTLLENICKYSDAPSGRVVRVLTVADICECYGTAVNKNFHTLESVTTAEGGYKFKVGV